MEVVDFNTITVEALLARLQNVVRVVAIHVEAKSGYTMRYTFIFKVTQLVSSQAMSTIE